MGKGELKIEKGIPIPSPRKGRRPSMFTRLLGTMQKGDSFIDSGPAHLVGKRVDAWRRKMGKDHKFVCRTVEGGTRIWRTK